MLGLRLFAGLFAVSLIQLVADPQESRTKEESVPFVIRDISGPRPFVMAKLNGKPFEMMVHSGASFYAQTDHARAKSIGITPPTSDSNYGISAVGHVSSLGKGQAVLDSLVVGSSVSSRVPISVFEVPVPSMEGMLGRRWLTENSVIVDFGNRRLIFPSSHDSALAYDAFLVAHEYSAHRMIEGAESGGRSLIAASVNGTSGLFLVSTVANTVLDVQFADRAGIAHSASGEAFGGPTGTTGATDRSKTALSFLLDGQAVRKVTPEVFDTLAYDGQGRSKAGADHSVGSLGADFMLANHAVIDFATATLLVSRGGRHLVD
jgi:predicted aspartyl protease